MFLNPRQPRSGPARIRWSLALILLLAGGPHLTLIRADSPLEVAEVDADSPPGAAEADSPPGVAEESRVASQAAAVAFQSLQGLIHEAESLERRELERVPDSLLRWSNPAAGRVYGDVFLWTDAGRPAAIASIYRWFHPYQSLTAEFCALSDATLSVERHSRPIWRPSPAEIAWKPVPGAPVPAAVRPGRLRQMRGLASRFRAILTDERVDTGGVITELRLLPRPVYEYDLEASPGAGGALFAFVAGTDPEVLLLLEAGGSGSEPVWHYVLARMNRDALEIRLDEEPVWKAEHLSPRTLFDSRQPYCCVELPLADVSATSPAVEPKP